MKESSSNTIYTKFQKKKNFQKNTNKYRLLHRIYETNFRMKPIQNSYALLDVTLQLRYTFIETPRVSM